jgi:hypothetical protein
MCRCVDDVEAEIHSGPEPAQAGLGKASQVLVYWDPLGNGNEAWPNTYRQPDGVRT